jgi:hypothetical protein
MTDFLIPSRGARALVALSVCIALLPACGGGDLTEAPVGETAAAAEAWRAESDYGPGDRPGPAGAVERGPLDLGPQASSMPVDPAARTRRGLYVSRSLAERADLERGGDIVWIDAGCCAGAVREGDGHDLAVMLAFATQAAKHLGPDAPFFVHGSDLRGAARLVDRLVATGARHSYLVTP